MNKIEIISLKLQYVLGVFDGLKLQNRLGIFGGWARFLQLEEIQDYDGDLDLIAHPLDFEQLRLWKPEQCFKGTFGDEGIRVGSICEVYPSACGIGYEYLKQGAVEMGEYFIVSLPWLLAQSTTVWASDQTNQRTRHTVELLMSSLDFKPENRKKETA
jgi:hypothetical protein